MLTYKFWMLWVEEEGMPRTRHSSQKEAEEEAERLARKTGKRVFLLEVMKVCGLQPSLSPVAWQGLSEPLSNTAPNNLTEAPMEEPARWRPWPLTISEWTNP